MNVINELQRISSLDFTEPKIRPKPAAKPKSRRSRRAADREKLRQLKLSALGNADIDVNRKKKKD